MQANFLDFCCDFHKNYKLLSGYIIHSKHIAFLIFLKILGRTEAPSANFSDYTTRVSAAVTRFLVSGKVSQIKNVLTFGSIKLFNDGVGYIRTT